MDDADVMDHEDLQKVGDVKEDQVDADEHLPYFHQESQHQVGDGANDDPPESTEDSDTGQKLTDPDDDAVNIRFNLLKQGWIILEIIRIRQTVDP